MCLLVAINEVINLMKRKEFTKSRNQWNSNHSKWTMNKHPRWQR